MICDICGGTLVMQPGATAKCDCCGMDYSTESLKAKFASSQAASNMQKENSSVLINGINSEPSGRIMGTTVETKYEYTPITSLADEAPKKEVKKEISETERKLAQFFQEASLAERMLEIRKIWKNLGLHEISDLQELNKMIDDKAEFERFYGFQNRDVAALVSEWEREYGVELPEEVGEDVENEEIALPETKKEFIDLFCPGCNEKLSFYNWQVTIGEQFICPYCGNSFALKEEQILY